jgi:amino acid transporter
MVTENTAEKAESGQPTLKRVMGSKLLYFFVIGDIMGTGIYTLTGSVAGEVGGALWLPFLLAFAVAFLTACSYLELVGKYPQAAGAALYTNKAFGIHFLTFMVMFTVMCSGITSASTAANGFGGTYLPRAFDIELDTWMIAVIAVVFIGMLAAINFIGVSESVKANVVLTIVELSGLLIIIGIGVIAVLSGDGEPSRLTEFDTSESNVFVAITGATSLAFFAMVGFEDSVNMAEECHNPAKIFPKVLILGLATAALIYILVAITSSILLTPEQMEAEGTDSLLKVIEVGAPGFPLKVFAFIGLIAVVNSALINMLMASRLVYGMANEGVIWRGFGTVHPFRRTPWVSILATSGIAAALLIFTAGSDAVKNLGSTTGLLLLLVFTVVNIAVLVLRKDKVEHKHFRAPTWAPVLAAVACVLLALPGLSGKDIEYLIAGGLLAVGVVAWVINWITQRTRGAQVPEPHLERLSEDMSNMPTAIVPEDESPKDSDKG